MRHKNERLGGSSEQTIKRLGSLIEKFIPTGITDTIARTQIRRAVMAEELLPGLTESPDRTLVKVTRRDDAYDSSRLIFGDAMTEPVRSLSIDIDRKLAGGATRDILVASCYGYSNAQTRPLRVSLERYDHNGLVGFFNSEAEASSTIAITEVAAVIKEAQNLQDTCDFYPAITLK